MFYGVKKMKSDYKIRYASKKECEGLLTKYHYLTNISRGFKSGKNFGLIYNEKVVGVCIFTGLPVPELAKSMFGLNRDEQDGIYELSRLVLHPDHQFSEHNLAGWFVARSIKMLRADNNVRSILSYADNDHHNGTVYRAIGFEYYGLTAPKSDFWLEQDDGTFLKHNRGTVKGRKGEWRPRSQKHRFLKIFDDTLSILWAKADCT